MMLLVSIQDTKGESYSNPTSEANKATAIRDFATVVNTPGTLLNQHPEDFVLVAVASWDSSSGLVKPLHEALAVGTDVFKESK